MKTLVTARRIRFFLALLCCTASLLLSSCAQHAGSNDPFLFSSADYLRLAQNATPPEQQRYQLLAVNLMIQEDEIASAQRTLNQLNEATLTTDQLPQKALLQAHIDLLSNQTDQALTILQHIEENRSALNTDNEIMLHQLLATAYEKTGNLLASINQRSTLNDLLETPAARQANLIEIWNALQSTSPSTLIELRETSDSSNLNGWLDLALITNTTSNNATLFKKLKAWQSEYEDHPANTLLASDSKGALEPITTPQHIALFLPLKGPLTNQATAIRNGFFAAYYYDKKQRKQNKAPTITVFDTSQGQIAELYQQAVQEGADFIVGPLEKSNVAAMMSANSNTPTLALNALSNSSLSENFYQFGLSPLDEAKQVALKAWGNQKSSAIVIAPEGDWGQYVSSAFQNQWKALGGKVLTEMNYKNRSELAGQIRKLMNISDADQRTKKLNRILNEKLRTVPRRRQDVDMIFLVATSTQAHQIVPLLKFYYAGNIPIYSISSIYTGTPNPKQDHDLNDVHFDDMPWVIASNTMSADLITIKQNISTLWPTGLNQYSRLYALGVDAYQIIPELGKLALQPQYNIKGATGTLYLDSRQHLYRKLRWAKMVNGRPQLMQP